MKKILLLLMFIIYSASFIYAIETKAKTETDTLTKISVLEEQIKNIKDIMDLNKQTTRDFLRDCDNNQKNQTLIVDNVKYYINSILLILGIVVTVFGVVLGFFVWKENKKSRDSMLIAKKDYEKAQEFYEKAVEKMEQCSDKLNSKIEEFDKKFDKMFKEKEQQFNELYAKKEQQFNELYTKKEQQFNELYINKEKGLQFLSNEIKNISKVVKDELKNSQEVSSLILEMNKEILKENFSNVLSLSERIIKLDKNNEWGYYGKAIALFENSKREHDLENSLYNIEKAISTNKNQEIFKFTKALICCRLGKEQEALDIYMSLKNKDTSVRINMIEIKIIMNKVQDAKKDLTDIIPENDTDRIKINILKAEIMCIEDKEIQEIRQFIQENIFKPYKGKKLYWSFKEVYSSLILNGDSYLNDSKKDKLNKIIEYIKQFLKIE